MTDLKPSQLFFFQLFYRSLHFFFHTCLRSTSSHDGKFSRQGTGSNSAERPPLIEPGPPVEGTDSFGGLI